MELLQIVILFVESVPSCWPHWKTLLEDFNLFTSSWRNLTAILSDSFSGTLCLERTYGQLLTAIRNRQFLVANAQKDFFKKYQFCRFLCFKFANEWKLHRPQSLKMPRQEHGERVCVYVCLCACACGCVCVCTCEREK